MKIVISNPCFIGDIVCGIPIIQVYKQIYPDSHITYIYEENRYSNPKEPISILEKESSLDKIICLSNNTIPRALDKPNDYNQKWAKNFLSEPVDIYIDLHKYWKGSNGRNWFDCAGLDFDKYYTRLKFFPSDDEIMFGQNYKGLIGISDRIPICNEILSDLKKQDIPCTIIGESMGVSLIKVYSAINNLKCLVQPCSVHNTLCWATDTPNLLCWSLLPEFMAFYGTPNVTFDYQNSNTTIVKTWNKDIIMGYIDSFI